MSNRIVITGLGAVTPVGNSVDSFWNSLVEGKSGITNVTHFDASDLPTKVAGEVKDIDFSEYVDPKEANRTDRYILLAIAAAAEAVKDAGITKDLDHDRIGTIVASGVGGLNYLEQEANKLAARGPRRVSPFFIPMMIADMASGMVSIKHGFRGPNYGVVSACASGAHAIGDALLGLKAGMMDICIAGGAEAAVTRLGFAGFCSMKAMSTHHNDEPQKASAPFSATRDGFVMGEGAGVLVLETLASAEKRGAKIYAELVGYGATGDAYHLSSPAPGGEGAARAMQMALTMAGMKPEDIDYVNAHGTSTAMNDKNETLAIKSVFGDHAKKLSISSTKSMTGHLLGASGGIEAVAAVKAINENICPPTINYDTPDPELDLDYTPNTAVKKEVKAVMSNSLGFGGHNATIIIKEFVK